MWFRRSAMAGMLLVSFATAACGGGGGGGSVAPSVNAGGTPTATPAPQTLSASAGGISATLNVSATAAVTAQAATTNPTGTGVLSLRRIASLASGTPLLYVTLSAASSTTITAIAGTFALASVPSQSVFLAFWTGTEWDSVSTTPATVNGTTAAFASVALSPAVVADPNAYFALYTASGALPTPSPSPTATATTGAAFVDTACGQAMASGQDGSLLNVASTFFSTIVPQGKVICLSAWDLSGNVTSALEAAAQAGASVTVITPLSENSSNSSDIAGIVTAGGHAKYEYTSSESPGTPTASIAYQLAPMDIHAKFAIIDGIAYMDGHNWFMPDVVLRDKNAADYAAIKTDLTTFPASPPGGNTDSFTTDKQLSLQNESSYLQSTAIPGLTSSANEFDFITESFNPNPASGDYNDDVYDGMCEIASLAVHPTVHVLVEDYSDDSPAAKAALQNLVLLDPNAVVRTENAGGLEKISMIRPSVGTTPSSAWFGSSNSTTTDLFDWGMNISDSGVLSALQNYYDNTAFPTGTAIPTASPGTTPAPCATTHP
jgi:hypothetical protein